MTEGGIVQLLTFLALLSINLAVLNFLPIPVLDGGHMVFLLYELITGKRPGTRILMPAIYIGLALLGSLMVLVLFMDVFYHNLGFFRK